MLSIENLYRTRHDMKKFRSRSETCDNVPGRQLHESKPANCPWFDLHGSGCGSGRVRLVAGRGCRPSTAGDISEAGADLPGASWLQVRRDRQPQRVEPLVLFYD